MRSKLVFVGSLATVLTFANAAQAAPLLVVSAEAGGEAVLVDPAKAQVIERIKVGARPRGLKLSRDKRRLLVALAGPAKPAPGAKAGAAPAGEPSAGLAIVDVAGRKVAKHVPTAPSPAGVDLSPDGRTAYLSNSETNELVIIDVATGSLKKKVPVGLEPRGVAVRPDGKVVYVATRIANEVSTIDAKTLSFLGRIDAGMKPQMVLFASGGQTAFVPGEEIPSITILDTKRNMSKEQFVMQGLAKKGYAAPVLQSAVFSPDGRSIYVTTGPGRSVLIVDPTKKAAIGTIDDVGAFPRGIAISSDGKKLYTANGPSNDVAIIDVASKKVEKRIAVPGAPWDIVLLP